MMGSIQLLMHFAITGGGIGIGLAAFKGKHLIILIGAAIMWVAFMGHFAEATWIPHFGKGRDFVDRIGILVRGLGFLGMTGSLLIMPGWASILLAVFSMGFIVFGRALWELAVIDQHKK